MGNKSEIYLFTVVIAALALLDGLVWYKTGFAHPIGALRVPVELIRSGDQWPAWVIYGYSVVIGLALIAVAANPFRGRDQYGNARWATERDLKRMGLRDREGIIIGQKDGRYIRTAQPLSVLVIAPPGAGKTAGCIIPTLFSCGNSMIINDPKGELFEKTSKRRSGFSKVVRFAPAEHDSVRWNPLSNQELPDDWNDKITRVQQIANTVIVSKADQGDDYWERDARSVFMFFALYLLHRDGGTSLPAIRELSLSGEDPQDLMLEILGESDLPQRIHEEGNTLANMSKKQFDGIFGTYRSHMDMFSDPRVQANLADSDFTIDRLRKECTSVYLCVAAKDQKRLAPLISMFFEFATLSLINRAPAKDEFSVTYSLDELVRLRKMEEVINMPAISRSYRVNAIFVVQTESQLKEIYGREGLEKIKGVCAYHVLFTQNEVSSAENYSRAVGKFTRKRESVSRQSGKWSKSTSESAEGYELLTAQQILSLPEWDILIFRQNWFNRPVWATAAMWFKDRAQRPLIGSVDRGREAA